MILYVKTASGQLNSIRVDALLKIDDVDYVPQQQIERTDLEDRVCRLEGSVQALLEILRVDLVEGAEEKEGSADAVPA